MITRDPLLSLCVGSQVLQEQEGPFKESGGQRWTGGILSQCRRGGEPRGDVGSPRQQVLSTKPVLVLEGGLKVVTWKSPHLLACVTVWREGDGWYKSWASLRISTWHLCTAVGGTRGTKVIRTGHYKGFSTIVNNA
ncbi:hypothetical protein CB1_000568019 [Camelus ferus]|nr:hypothetical protein CB1_000568019 [Camelus ferus]